jgi:ectoine hydroxylase-related dioxygenase (phytanoyl-CoA dioxygenase family)
MATMTTNLVDSDASEAYRTDGLVSYPGVIDVVRFSDIEETLRRLICSAVDRLPDEARAVFNARRYDDDQLLHEGMIHLYELDPRLEQYVVDGICNSRALYRFVSDDGLLELVAATLGVPAQDLSMNDVFVRVDLPNRFEEHVAKIALPYHQDSSYYPYNVSPSTGVVIWVPLFDCGPNDGAMEVCLGSHTEGAFTHEEHYEDPVGKTHFRTRLPASVTDRYRKHTLDVQRGTLVLQHFLLAHRSGINRRENRVRYTILARTSYLLASDFRPVSWR